MIIDGFLLVLQGVLQVLLLPLTGINIVVDFVSSIPVITSFLECVAYLLPWDNILPLIALLVAIFIFRSVMAVIRFIRSVIIRI